MTTLKAIVEGHGDCEAATVLIRRILAAHDRHDVTIQHQRGKRDQLVKAEHLGRAVQLAALSADAILVLVDADDDCVRLLAPQMLADARNARPDRRIEVVLAEREFETWFLHGAKSLAGVRGLPSTLDSPDDPVAIHDAKGWIRERAGRYTETVDQAKLAARLDLDATRRASRSFDKLVRAVLALVD